MQLAELHRQPENADLLTAWLVQHGTEAEVLDLYNELLRRAAAEGDRAQLVQLLACGAEVDGAGADGSTALQLAAEYQQLGALEILVGAGADVDACNDNGLTPLLLAVSSHDNGGADGDVEGVVRALLAEGAVVDAVDDDGQSALMAAASEGRTALAQLLLEAGADWRGVYRSFAETYPEYLPGPNDNHMGLAHGLDGASALSLAKAGGHSETAIVLESWVSTEEKQKHTTTPPP